MTTARGGRELGGRELARQLRATVAERAAALAKEGREPRLAVVTATDDGGSAAYVRSIANAAAREGIACDVARTTTAAGITATLAQLADDPEVHGIILQTPLPGGASLAGLAAAIPAAQGRGRRKPGVDRPPGGGPARVRPGHRGGGARAPRPLPGGAARAGTRWWWAGRSSVGKPAAHLLLDRQRHRDGLPLADRGPPGDHPAGRRAGRGGRPGRADRPRSRRPRDHRHRRGARTPRRTAASRATSIPR